MKRLLIPALLLMLFALAQTALPQEAYRNHLLLKVLLSSKQQLRELHSYTNLDVVPGETMLEPQVIALPEDLDFLTRHGFTYEIVHENLERFYASRLESPLETMGGYRVYSEIVASLDSIHNAHPNIATAKFNIGNSIEGRAMWVMEITNLADSATAKPEVFYNSLTHAREPAAMECMIYFMHWLTDNYGTDAQATYLVNNRKMYFLPCVNPDGYEYNRINNPGGGGMYRKNRRVNGDGSYGVDLNRNFDAAWGLDDTGSSPVPSSDTYRGSAAFSEPETQHFRDFVNAHQFITEEDFHTYSNYVLIPWGTSYYPPPSGSGLCADDDTYRSIVDSMSWYIRQVNGARYATGAPWQVLYNTNGGSIDWSYGDPSHWKVFAVSTEVGGASDGFWPPSNRIIPLAQENLPALIYLARVAGELYPSAQDASLLTLCQSELGGNGNGIVEPGESLTLTLTLHNVGTQALQGLSGTLTSLDPDVTIFASTSAWPQLAVGASGVNSTVFQLDVSASSPAYHVANCRLHLTSSGGLDADLEVPVAIGSLALSDNVESGSGGWTTGGNWNLWHVSTRRAQSATHAWFCGRDDGNYSDYMTDWLMSDTLFLAPGAELSFDHYYDLEQSYDYGFVEYNTGSGWMQLGIPITGQSGGWVHATHTLNITCPGTPVRIRFRMTSDQGTTGEGWYVDNISTGCPVPPVQSVSPLSLSGLAPLAGTDLDSIQICNPGGCLLSWNVSYQQISPASMEAPVHRAVTTLSENDDAVRSKEDSDDGRSVYPLDAQGGPDAFGYRWKDSNEPDGPAYNWVEIAAGGGTQLPFTTDDQVIEVTLPWAFTFYGVSYTTARISANGNIHFGADSTDYTNRALPNMRLPNATIAAFWDDLSPHLTGGRVFVKNDTANARFIVQYDSVAHYTSSPGRYTFEAILYRTGRIVYQYQSLTGTLNSCTIGIENAAGTVGLTVVHNADYVAANLAIELMASVPWLTILGPSSGGLTPGSCVYVPVQFNAGALAAGTYSGNVVVQSNDGAHSPTTIPVTFIVGMLLPPEHLAAGYDPDTQTLTLRWDNAGASQYKVYSATSASGPFTTLVGTTTSTTLTIPSVASDKLFYVVVSSD